jgi:hypothetical protein
VAFNKSVHGKRCASKSAKDQSRSLKHFTQPWHAPVLSLVIFKRVLNSMNKKLSLSQMLYTRNHYLSPLTLSSNNPQADRQS